MNGIPRSPGERDRAIARLRSITIGTTVISIVAVGGFGAVAALSDSDATPAITTAALTSTSAAATSDTSATTDTIQATAAPTAASTAASATTSTASAHATTGGS